MPINSSHNNLLDNWFNQRRRWDNLLFYYYIDYVVKKNIVYKYGNGLIDSIIKFVYK